MLSKNVCLIPLTNHHQFSKVQPRRVERIHEKNTSAFATISDSNEIFRGYYIILRGVGIYRNFFLLLLFGGFLGQFVMLIWENGPGSKTSNWIFEYLNFMACEHATLRGKIDLKFHKPIFPHKWQPSKLELKT